MKYASNHTCDKFKTYPTPAKIKQEINLISLQNPTKNHSLDFLEDVRILNGSVNTLSSVFKMEKNPMDS